MNNNYIIALLTVILLSLPFIGITEDIPLHFIITILIWSFAYTGWSIMGRFGLVSLGHGAFMAMVRTALLLELLWRKHTLAWYTSVNFNSIISCNCWLSLVLNLEL